MDPQDSAINPPLYYCPCSEFTLTTSHPLSTFPIRPYDQSIIVPADVKYRIFATRHNVTLKRTEGYEQRIEWRCNRCEIPVAYEILEYPWLYVIQGALQEQTNDSVKKESV
ncbi:hypothetical protein NEOLI_005412 [Neolecta irregularis DAH-3]|uniref:STEEP1 domain-containing protein n=1 Tax=Neolecta irregularis (strain DAH-3) TaxID=1198029 RepID=A0A1U7LM34_NEOID|nr:hypothetical protein NEOLI_005412 [Neolecta irregularis DAH-3]|eukprot:OLL23602.1 hypothetical protein NEOLI_005412 [Neolecta irregularis DAH-3]